MAATQSTPANLVIGAGNAYKAGSDVGVTADDNVFRIEEERFEPDNLNGLPGLLKDTMYIVSSTGMLEVTVPEISAERLADTWPGSRMDTDDETGLVTIDRDGNARRVPSSAYADWELRVKGATRIYGFYLRNAINTGNAEFTLQNAGLAVPRLELGSRWDAPPAPGSGEDPEDVVYPSPHGITYRAISVGS
jgi:hypothetical protein